MAHIEFMFECFKFVIYEILQKKALTFENDTEYS